jgi:hypothetical protein
MTILENDKNYYERIIASELSTADVCYTVNNQRVTNKLQAIELANYDTAKITYSWLENRLDQVNWTIEPDECLNDLVDRHVNRIRNLYDHVALHWSGGYDSYTILKAFVRNNIKIDELIIYSRDWWNRGILDLDNQMAIDSANFVKTHWMPELKITQIKWGDKNMLVKHFNKTGLDWIYTNGGQSKINQNSRAILGTQNDDVIRTHERSGRSIQLNGIDKPRVNLRNGQWYSVRSDSCVFQEADDWSLHFWYLPDLYLKQTWMMIRWLETLEQISHEFVHRLQGNGIDDFLYMQWNLALNRELPLFSYLQGRNTKSVFAGAWAEETKDLIDNIQISDPELYRCWLTGVEQIETVLSQVKSLGKSNVIMSKEYFIKPFEPRAITLATTV